MDVHAVARLRRVEQGREARAQLVPAGDVAHDLPEHDAAVRGRDPLGGRDRDLELVRAYSEMMQFGLHARLEQRAHHVGGERFRHVAAPPARTAALAGASLTSWNSCSKLASDARRRARPRAPAGRRAGSARTALPRPTVGLDDVAEHELQGALLGAGLDADVACPDPGSRRRSPVEPNGLGSARAPSGVSEWLAGTQPTPASRRPASSSAGSERPRTIAPRSQQTSATSSVVLTPAPPSSRHLGTVPLSQRPSTRPSAPAAAARTVGGVRGVDDHDHPARGHARAARAPRPDAPRLHVDAPVAERRVGVGHAVQAARRALDATDHAHEVPDIPVGRRAGQVAVEQDSRAADRAPAPRPRDGG